MAESNKTIIGVLADQKAQLEEELADAYATMTEQGLRLGEADANIFTLEQETVTLRLEKLYLAGQAAKLAVRVNELTASNFRLNAELDVWSGAGR